MTIWPDRDDFRAAWRDACAGDAVLAAYAGPWDADFAIAQDDAVFAFAFREGRIAVPAAAAEFVFAAPEAVWAKFLEPIPPRHHHVVLAMLARVPEVRLSGDTKRFAQMCHVLRRVLEIGKHLARGCAVPVPNALRPSIAPISPKGRAARSISVNVHGVPHTIFMEEAGQGRDVLCLHTAGADRRQFHRLMADPRITAEHRLVAFDLPWHGASEPTPGALPALRGDAVAAVRAADLGEGGSDQRRLSLRGLRRSDRRASA